MDWRPPTFLLLTLLWLVPGTINKKINTTFKLHFQNCLKVERTLTKLKGTVSLVKSQINLCFVYLVIYLSYTIRQLFNIVVECVNRVILLQSKHSTKADVA